MGKFLESEKESQINFKENTIYFSNSAKKAGTYGRGEYKFCLPIDSADENLYSEIRHDAIKYFQRQDIKWHQGLNHKPNNHLCSSQVFCVNFLFPFALNPNALVELLRPIYPEILSVTPMEVEFPNQYVCFEWIGFHNYLLERIRRGNKRTRGANFTSADAAVVFQRTDGLRQIVMIEWKYTESYGATPLAISKNGTDRTLIYAHLYDSEDCPIKRIGEFGDLFYEPFYQLMRQQMLAKQMEKYHEFGADIVSVLHISPKHNTDFKRVTSDKLRYLGDSPVEIWKKLVKSPGVFTDISTEKLFMGFPISGFPELKSWHEYMSKRYSWITE